MTHAVSLDAALARCRPALGSVAGYSLVINLLTLTSSLYMMQVFDRVLASRSVETLGYLTLIAVGALLLMGALDYLRTRILGALGDWIERRIGPVLLERIVDDALAGRNQQSEMIRDVAALRGALGGGALFLLDVPWVPIYLAAVYLLHPLLGHVAFAAAALLFILALANDWATRRPQREAGEAARSALAVAGAAARNAGTVEAMNLLPGLTQRWWDRQSHALDLQDLAQRRSAILLNLTKCFRQIVQVVILAVGAWLVLAETLSGGAMIAASIVMGRALGPIEQAIGGWKQVRAAHDSLQRLRVAFDRPRRRSAGLSLPAPAGRLEARDLFFRPPGRTEPVLRGVSFALRPGEAAAIVGPAAAGKSTLARLLVGLHAPTAGSVRLDDADAHLWRRDEFGRHVGYLPQDVDLFEGTVAENIARMATPDAEAVAAAAALAGCHSMILHLPHGYDTEIGPGGSLLSGGQRQRVALARALYGRPRLVVLDEPNANLDSEGEQALNAAVAAMKSLGSCVILIGHRPSTLAQVDRVIALRDGRIDAQGPRAEVMEMFRRRAPQSVGEGASTRPPIREAADRSVS